MNAPQVSSTGTPRSSASPAIGRPRARPSEVLTRYEVIDTLAPMRIGPSVITAQ